MAEGGEDYERFFSGTDPQPCEKLIPVCLRTGSHLPGNPPHSGRLKDNPDKAGVGGPSLGRPLEPGGLFEPLLGPVSLLSPVVFDVTS
ncbi:hypothetical protein SRHO_G00332060 [Serrasalmus rhombeus]